MLRNRTSGQHRAVAGVLHRDLLRPRDAVPMSDARGRTPFWSRDAPRACDPLVGLARASTAALRLGVEPLAVSAALARVLLFRSCSRCAGTNRAPICCDACRRAASLRVSPRRAGTRDLRARRRARALAAARAPHVRDSDILLYNAARARRSCSPTSARASSSTSAGSSAPRSARRAHDPAARRRARRRGTLFCFTRVGCCWRDHGARCSSCCWCWAAGCCACCRARRGVRLRAAVRGRLLLERARQPRPDAAAPPGPRSPSAPAWMHLSFSFLAPSLLAVVLPHPPIAGSLVPARLGAVLVGVAPVLVFLIVMPWGAAPSSRRRARRCCWAASSPARSARGVPARPFGVQCGDALRDPVAGHLSISPTRSSCWCRRRAPLAVLLVAVPRRSSRRRRQSSYPAARCSCCCTRWSYGRCGAVRLGLFSLTAVGCPWQRTCSCRRCPTRRWPISACCWSARRCLSPSRSSRSASPRRATRVPLAYGLSAQAGSPVAFERSSPWL